jgi:hypothetical protein
MKTHDLAKALTHLARVLRAGPNVDFEELTNLSTYLTQSRPTKVVKEADRRDQADKGTALALLAEMASYNKQELLELTDYLGIPVEVRKADAVRDILGKTLKYIHENPAVRDRLVSNVSDNRPERSSSLARALEILMKQP